MSGSTPADVLDLTVEPADALALMGDSNRIVLDHFAGPGGWSTGIADLLHAAGLVEVGLEWDAAACLTRIANGHTGTLRADVAAYPVCPFLGRTVGYIGSPPCQTFSMAGGGSGREHLAILCTEVRRILLGLDHLRRGDDPPRRSWRPRPRPRQAREGHPRRPIEGPRTSASGERSTAPPSTSSTPATASSSSPPASSAPSSTTTARAPPTSSGSPSSRSRPPGPFSTPTRRPSVSSDSPRCPSRSTPPTTASRRPASAGSSSRPASARSPSPSRPTPTEARPSPCSALVVCRGPAWPAPSDGGWTRRTDPTVTGGAPVGGGPMAVGGDGVPQPIAEASSRPPARSAPASPSASPRRARGHPVRRPRARSGSTPTTPAVLQRTEVGKARLKDGEKPTRDVNAEPS